MTDEPFHEATPTPSNQENFSHDQPNLDEKLIRDTRQWAMFLHLSQLLSVSMAGVVVPIVLWQIKKDEYPGIDEHGKNVMNWMISAFIYGIVSFILCPFFIGFPMLFVLGIACFAFPIIGGIKANNGEMWEYPLAIKFLK